MNSATQLTALKVLLLKVSIGTTPDRMMRNWIFLITVWSIMPTVYSWEEVNLTSFTTEGTTTSLEIKEQTEPSGQREGEGVERGDLYTLSLNALMSRAA